MSVRHPRKPRSNRHRYSRRWFRVHRDAGKVYKHPLDPIESEGRSGILVSMRAFTSEEQSLNYAELFSFSVKCFKNENELKDDG